MKSFVEINPRVLRQLCLMASEQIGVERRAELAERFEQERAYDALSAWRRFWRTDPRDQSAAMFCGIYRDDYYNSRVKRVKRLIMLETADRVFLSADDYVWLLRLADQATS